MNPDQKLDALLRAARAATPDTDRAEFALETRVLSRLREERSGAWFALALRLSPLFAALAYTGAYINLFNLSPIWQLDGSHAWRALTQMERYVVTGVAAAALFMGGPAVSILWLVLICAGYRLFQKDAAPASDGRTLPDFVILIAALTFIAVVTAR